MKRLAGTLAFLGVSIAAGAVSAQEIQIRGPLANAPSCHGCIQYRAGRVSISPTFGISLQDEFDRSLWVGAQIQYHFNDLIGIGVWGSYALGHVPTALTSAIRSGLATDAGGAPLGDPTPGAVDQASMVPNADKTQPAYYSRNIPRGEHFNQQIGQMNWFLSAPQITITPLRGKMALFQNIFIDTDFYLFLGLGIIGLTERANYDVSQGAVDDFQHLAENQQARSSRVAFTATFGAGLNFYINHFLSLAVEYRAFPFAWNTSGFDVSSSQNTCGFDPNNMSNPAHYSCAGFPDYQVRSDHAFIVDQNDRTFHWNQMVNFSLNVFLPTEPRRGQ
jgi:outer membrane beta-barrel protein